MTTSRSTRHTLIRRACDPGDEAAWVEFDRIYRRFIIHVLGQMNVPVPEIEDLTQQILATLIRDMGGYDRSKAGFRTWLSAVIRHAAFSHFRQNRFRQQTLDRFREETATPDVLSTEAEIDAKIESEWASYVANLAMDRVRTQFQGGAIEVFEMGWDDTPAEEIARRTGYSVASVYTLRKRVKKRLYLEIRNLIAELEP
ncbi:MAG: sigma-70 family RNA polymerase sigma factor [Verrucomicrobia bacterium]|nr:sigma-70 family RNA polymerase sigma factor [Verrucomicrobiota bacterium]